MKTEQNADAPIAFKIFPAKTTRGAECYTVQPYWKMAHGETTRGGRWSAGTACEVRKFVSVDAARHNALRAFGHIMER